MISFYSTGLVTVSTVARLDRDTNPHQYSLVINAVDAGFPFPETATTTVYVHIEDVNDKPPKYEIIFYIKLVNFIFHLISMLQISPAIVHCIYFGEEFN